ncbi:unknown [Corallococcus sp. CAG:1435]|nr:unknown [Corallococcus sp. CAG:1435]
MGQRLFRRRYQRRQTCAVHFRFSHLFLRPVHSNGYGVGNSYRRFVLQKTWLRSLRHYNLCLGDNPHRRFGCENVRVHFPMGRNAHDVGVVHLFRFPKRRIGHLRRRYFGLSCGICVLQGAQAGFPHNCRQHNTGAVFGAKYRTVGQLCQSGSVRQPHHHRLRRHGQPLFLFGTWTGPRFQRHCRVDRRQQRRRCSGMVSGDIFLRKSLYVYRLFSVRVGAFA